VTETAAHVDHQSRDDLFDLATEREAAKPQPRSHYRQFGSELLGREVLRAEEDGPLGRLRIHANPETEIESRKRGGTGPGVASAEGVMGHESTFLQAEGGLRGTPTRAKDAVKPEAFRAAKSASAASRLDGAPE